MVFVVVATAACSTPLTVEEAGRILGLSRGSMYKAVQAGSVPSLRIGRRILIPRKAVEQMCSGLSRESQPAGS